MSFNDFEKNAVKNYNKIMNPPEKVSNPKIKSRVNDEPVEIETFSKGKNKGKKGEDLFDEDFFDDGFDNNFNSYNDEMNLYPAQKPESFHFFILENQYQDLERLVRGVKDVWDKDKNKWLIKRKDKHCFTDEESEEIIRTAQSHLSSDIKLARFSREEYPIMMQSIYQQLWILFKEIMEYRFGRFKDLTTQLKMKQQALNIFNVLMMRIKANYSRAIEGMENKETHNSVKGQESLQQTERKDYGRSYS